MNLFITHDDQYPVQGVDKRRHEDLSTLCPTYLIRLQPKPGIDVVRALWQALKVLLRRFGLRAVEVKEEGLRVVSFDQPSIERMDNLLAKIEGINDERDSVGILMAVREVWPRIKQQLSQGGR